jgi:hypothetical protein
MVADRAVRIGHHVVLVDPLAGPGFGHRFGGDVGGGSVEHHGRARGGARAHLQTDRHHRRDSSRHQDRGRRTAVPGPM